MYAVDPETATALTSPSGTHVSRGPVTASAEAPAGKALAATRTTAIARRRYIRFPESHGWRAAAIGSKRRDELGQLGRMVLHGEVLGLGEHVQRRGRPQRAHDVVRQRVERQRGVAAAPHHLRRAVERVE